MKMDYQEEDEDDLCLAMPMDCDMDFELMDKKKTAPMKQNDQFSHFSMADKYTALISGQSSEGFWTVKSEQLIKAMLPKALPASSLSIECQLTLAALCLLEEMYGKKEQEWQMIFKKAKQWLVGQGIDATKLQDELLN